MLAAIGFFSGIHVSGVARFVVWRLEASFASPRHAPAVQPHRRQMVIVGCRWRSAVMR